MIGQRGLPATYGGVERHVEEIGARLVELGHEVIVYCRPNYSPEPRETYRGMTLERLNTPESKHLEAIIHSAGATIAAMRMGVDIVHYHALGPGLVSPLPRLFSEAEVVQTIHGLDHQRAKWGRVASGVLGLGCWMSARVPNRTVVVSQALQDYYASKYGKRTVYLCNGVDRAVRRPNAQETLDALGLGTSPFILYVGRLVPEKVPDMLIRAFRRIDRDDLRLVIAGSTSFTAGYVQTLQAIAAEDPRVIMPGNVLREPLADLYAHATAFVLPSDVEGMPLTLLEAASYGTPILASDIAPHRELLGDDQPGRRMFRHGQEDELLAKLQLILGDVSLERAGAASIQRRVQDDYSWDRTAQALSDLYLSIARKSARRASEQADVIDESSSVGFSPTQGLDRAV
jgi:glycosyltransferase involved in cell wall biosynthesis